MVGIAVPGEDVGGPPQIEPLRYFGERLRGLGRSVQAQKCVDGLDVVARASMGVELGLDATAPAAELGEKSTQELTLVL